MQPKVLYLGWDVGGWEGARDGLAVLMTDARGTLRLAKAPVRVGLKPLLCSGGLSVDDLLSACDCREPWDRMVLGIDAPLGWPAQFARSVIETPAAVPIYLPAPDAGEIANRLAYRWCDRVIHQACGKKPLSATFDRLGNNCTKAITACRLLAANDRARPAEDRVPEAPVTFLEAYPALWKAGAGKTGDPVVGAAAALAACHLPAAGSDELDAVLCALTAACYDNRARDLGLSLPQVAFPEDFAHVAEDPPEEIIAAEGWAYFPLDAAITRGA